MVPHCWAGLFFASISASEAVTSMYVDEAVNGGGQNQIRVGA